MSRSLRRIAPVLLLSAVAGCSTVKDAKDSVTDWFNGGNSTPSTTGKKAAGNNAAAKPATATPGYGTQPDTAVPPPAYMPRTSATSGLLLVNTKPPRAKVYLDDMYYGLSPVRLEMEPGVHTISVKLEGYKMATKKISVRKDDNTEMELNLER